MSIPRPLQPRSALPVTATPDDADHDMTDELRQGPAVIAYRASPVQELSDEEEAGVPFFAGKTDLTRGAKPDPEPEVE